MALCIGCSSGIHEYEDCPFRDAVSEMRAAGIYVTAGELRDMEEAAREERR